MSALLRSAALALAALGGLGACGAEPADPHAELLARARRRLELVVARDVRGLEELTLPAAREEFLASSEWRHRYESPSEPVVVAVEGDTAFVACSLVWRPEHPLLAAADDGSDVVETVQTWRRADGAWWFVESQRRADFFRARPELRR